MHITPDIEQSDANSRVKLAKLILEHADIDYAINALQKVGCDPLRMQRFKKKKLTLKDEIEQLKSQVIPDITA
ncbi:MAG: DUF465 domain-containing protein [Rhizobiaceae bacterium]|nr:DUF465 domain-containing protein [Rhizobiaceae bacterium]